jgi:hypothetical protein
MALREQLRFVGCIRVYLDAVPTLRFKLESSCSGRPREIKFNVQAQGQETPISYIFPEMESVLEPSRNFAIGPEKVRSVVV